MAKRDVATINGVSTHKVERLAKALGIKGRSASQVSEITRGLDGRVVSSAVMVVTASPLLERVKSLLWSPWTTNRRTPARHSSRS
jgi:hypothetical protein